MRSKEKKLVNGGKIIPLIALRLFEYNKGLCMTFYEFTTRLIGENYSNNKNYVIAKSDTLRKKLKKIINIVFDTNFYRFYFSKYELDPYWLHQEIHVENEQESDQEDILPQNIGSMVSEREECIRIIESEIEEKTNSLAVEKRIHERETLQKRKDNLKRQRKRIQKEIDILVNWDNEPPEKVMKLIDKDTVYSALGKIGDSTADLYTFMLHIEAFEHVSTKVDSCEILGKINPNDREELAKKIIIAYDKDESFKKYIKKIIYPKELSHFFSDIESLIGLKRNELVSFFPEFESLIEFNYIDEDLNLILYPIMYPNKYMLLRSGYLILRGEGEYTDEDAHNMLTNNREPYGNLPEAKKWKKEDTQLSWITKHITASIDSALDNDDVDVEEELHKIIEQRLNGE